MNFPAYSHVYMHPLANLFLIIDLYSYFSKLFYFQGLF